MTAHSRKPQAVVIGEDIYRSIHEAARAISYTTGIKIYPQQVAALAAAGGCIGGKKVLFEVVQEDPAGEVKEEPARPRFKLPAPPRKPGSTPLLRYPPGKGPLEIGRYVWR